MTGFVNGDTQAGATSGQPSLTTTAVATSPVGPYTITAATGTLASTNYTFSFVNSTLTVGQATLTVTAQPALRIYGAPNPTFTYQMTGFVNGDTQASATSGQPSLTTAAGPASPVVVGGYPILAALGTLSATNYSFGFVNGTLTVIQATPVPAWTPQNATLPHGGALSAAQLNATFTDPTSQANVAGAIAYTEGANPVSIGTVLSPGPHTLTATFTPADPVDYVSGGTATTTITWESATPSVTKIGTYNAGQWYLDVSGTGAWAGDPPDVAGSFGAGLPGAIPVVGDWNGDGHKKMGVFYQGFWYLDFKGDGVWDGGVVDKQYIFGWSDPNVIPVVGDWNGDGRTKIGVYYQGFWYLDYDGNGIWDGGINDKTYNIGWPATGVTPIVGDWSGTGTSKIGIYYYGFWYLDYDGDGVWNPAKDKSYNFGWQATGVTPIMGDWNGDGRAKIGIYYYGFWYLDYDGNGVWDGGVNDKMYNLGWSDPAVMPVVGDWTGTGTTKIGVFYDGYWYLDFKGNGIWDGGIVDKAYVWGQPGDTPVVGAW
jgi:hypothetical protein